MTRYRLLHDISDLGEGAPSVGDVVQECHQCDYGMQSDHERWTGEAHINISRDGDYPFFTIPIRYVELLEESK